MKSIFVTTPTPLILPGELDEELTDILGRANFQCAPFAIKLRQLGAVIPQKAEAEQAYVIYFLLQGYAIYGKEWREKLSEWLDNKTIETRRTLGAEAQQGAVGPRTQADNSEPGSVAPLR